MNTSKPKTIRALGIDPGYDRMGIAVVEKSPSKKEEVLFSMCATTSPRDTFSTRLLSVCKEVERVIDEWNPDILAIETLLVTKNQKTAMRVSEVRGAVLYIAATKKIPVYEYSPVEIKLCVAGYGKAQKVDVDKMVRLLVSFPKKDVLDDEIDAVAAALTSLVKGKFSYPQE